MKRCNIGIVVLSAAVMADCAFAVSAGEPPAETPTVIERGPDWIPLVCNREIEKGSALDFSGMGFTDAPAGKYGWMRNAGGHLEFEGRPGKPVRLYGVNVCGPACFQAHGETEKMVARFKRFGYNAFRLHHHDQITVIGSKDGLALNAGEMDKFDYFVATAIREGFYITTDLFVTRSLAPIKWRHIGVDSDGNVKMQLFKALCAVYDPAFENWCAYARNFMTHVNPYTGRAYKDEPALSLVSLVNEGFLGWTPETVKDERVQAAWKKWLEGHPGVTPKETFRRDDAAFALFMGDVEAEMSKRMKDFLRGIGCKALLTNDNCGYHYAPSQMASGEYDYIDDHFYVDHPDYPEKGKSLPSRCDNKNPILVQGLSLCNPAFTRMAGKPFTVTEWNFCGPGMFRGAGGILTGAMAALQDWDGMWRFAYSKTRKGEPPGYFNIAADPLGEAAERACLCLFLRGDMAPLAAEDGVSILVTPASAKPADGWALPAAPSWSDAAWNMRVSSCLAAADAGNSRVVPREQAESPAVTNWVNSVATNPALVIDRARGAFAFGTPRTCGGFAPEGTISAGPLAAVLGGAAATVWASALDGNPVATSRRILLTHLTDLQGDGATFADKERKMLLKFGKAPLVRNGTAQIRLALAEPSAYEVYELDTGGGRLGTVPSGANGGGLAFTASVDGPHGARMLYEIVRKSNQ